MTGERRFGQEIARLRKKKEWSIRGFAKKVLLKENGRSMSPSYLCDIEQGRRMPPLEVIGRMAELLDGDLDELMILAKRTPPDIKEIVRGNEEIRRMLRKARDIGFQNWKEVEKLIETHEATEGKSNQNRTDQAEHIGE